MYFNFKIFEPGFKSSNKYLHILKALKLVFRNKKCQPLLQVNMSNTILFFLFTVDAVQLHTPSVPPDPVPLSQSLIVQNGPIADGMEQGRPVCWSALSQREKYSTKVLEMPYPLLYKICLTLDIQRADGNDVRMLAYKLGISLPDLAVLKQAAITQHPDNNYFNSTSYVVLTKNCSLAVGGFVDIMKEIERDDIICLINN